MRRIVRLVGVVITIIGWVLSNAEFFPIAYKLAVPKYVNAMAAYDKMFERGYTLKLGDIGFLEITELLKSCCITGQGAPVITQIKTVEWGTSLISREKFVGHVPYIELEISFANSQPDTGKIYEIKSEIEKKYLTHTLFTWRNSIFWLGILISIIGAFL